MEDLVAKFKRTWPHVRAVIVPRSENDYVHVNVTVLYLPTGYLEAPTARVQYDAAMDDDDDGEHERDTEDVLTSATAPRRLFTLGMPEGYYIYRPNVTETFAMVAAFPDVDMYSADAFLPYIEQLYLSWLETLRAAIRFFEALGRDFDHDIFEHFLTDPSNGSHFVPLDNTGPQIRSSVFVDKFDQDDPQLYTFVENVPATVFIEREPMFASDAKFDAILAALRGSGSGSSTRAGSGTGSSTRAATRVSGAAAVGTFRPVAAGHTVRQMIASATRRPVHPPP